MKTLEPIHKRFALLSICATNSSEPSIKFRNVALSVFCLILNTLACPARFTFILRNLKGDPGNALFELATTSANAVLCHMMIAGFILRYEITDIFSKFQDIYDTCRRLVNT